MEGFENFIPALMVCVVGWIIMGLIIWGITLFIKRKSNPVLTFTKEMFEEFNDNKPVLYASREFWKEFEKAMDDAVKRQAKL